MQYYILKQFIPNADVWVAKLDPSDTIYSYSTLEDAESDLPAIQLIYPDRALKIQLMGTPGL